MAGRASAARATHRGSRACPRGFRHLSCPSWPARRVPGARETRNVAGVRGRVKRYFQARVFVRRFEVAAHDAVRYGVFSGSSPTERLRARGASCAPRAEQKHQPDDGQRPERTDEPQQHDPAADDDQPRDHARSPALAASRRASSSTPARSGSASMMIAVGRPLTIVHLSTRIPNEVVAYFRVVVPFSMSCASA